MELPDGTRVVGTVGGLHGHVALRVEYSRLTPKQRMRSWVRLVALTAATGEPWRAVTVGRGERFGIARAIVGPLAAGAGARGARRAGGAARGGAVRAAAAVHRHRARRTPGSTRGGAAAADALAEAARAWTNGAGAERDDPAHERVWGRAAPAVGADPPRPGRRAASRPGSARSPCALWAPLLQVEDVVRR